MSAVDEMKLVGMANQIAGFFESQKGDGTADVAAHLNDNWAPPMRVTLAQASEAARAQMHPLVRAALAHLRLPAVQ